MLRLFTASSVFKSRWQWVVERSKAEAAFSAGLLPKAYGARSRSGIQLTRRYAKLTIASLVGLALLVAISALGICNRWYLWTFLGWPTQLPPDYARFHEYELKTSEQSVGDADARYIFFDNYVRGVGWGNVMQEVLLHAYLAYRLNRTFVYYNYTWRDNGSRYTLYNGRPIPSQIPLSVLLQGPVLGAPSMTDPSAPHPFAVSEVYYRSVCPEDQRVYVRMEQVLSTMGRSASAGDVIDKWIEVYADLPDRCVQVPRDAYHNIDYYIFGSAARLLDVWPVFAKSPVIRELAWSPLVELAFDQNRETFAPTDRYVTPLGIQRTTLSVYNEHSLKYAPIPGLLVVHVRRGDFDEHCKKLASWASPILGFNSFPSMPDTFLFPAGTTEGERIALQRPHCYPSIAEIVQRVVDVRVGEEGLTDVYFMTNGPEDWVDELKAAVQKTGGWRSVGSSRDLVLNWEQTFVKQAVDMLIGQRAQVFVGNGWSSLSGLVNMLRVANGVAAAKNRLL